MDAKKLLKIIIPICIFISVVGIWILKNSGNIVSPKNDKDFMLETTAIDLRVLTS